MSNVYETVARVTGTDVPNYDAEAGIHYGTCYVNDGILPEALDLPSWRDLTYEGAQETAIEELMSSIEDAATTWAEEALPSFVKERFVHSLLDGLRYGVETAVDDHFGEGYESNGEGIYLYEEEGYVVEFHASDNSIIVIKSPFYANVGGCSPCFPNGGYISKPGGVLAYTLGHDWWENGKAPTDIFEVGTNKKVLAPDL